MPESSDPNHRNHSGSLDPPRVAQRKITAYIKDHPPTLGGMQSLAVIYRRLGERLKEGQELEEKVLKVRKRIVREDHRGTPRAMYHRNKILSPHRKICV